MNGALPQRRVVWMWFGALPGAFGRGRAQPQRRGKSSEQEEPPFLEAVCGSDRSGGVKLHVWNLNSGLEQFLKCGGRDEVKLKTTPPSLVGRATL